MFGKLFRKRGDAESGAAAKAAPPASTAAGVTLPEIAEAFVRASNLHAEGRLADAEVVYSRILMEDPDNVETIHMLGVLNFQTGRTDEAIGLIERAVALDPGHAVAQGNLAQLYAGVQRIDESLAAYRRAIELAPANAALYSQRAALERSAGLFEEALQSCRTAALLDPSSADALNNLGSMLMQLGDTDAAIDAYRSARAAAPESSDVHCNLALALRERGSLDEAQQCVQRALELDPASARALCCAGELRRGSGDLEGAIAAYQRALEVDPRSFESANGMGVTLQLQGKLAEASSAFLNAIAMRPEYAAAHTNLGMVLAQLGRNPDAIAALRRSLALKPDFWEGYSNLLFYLTHSADISPEEILAEHRTFGARLESTVADRRKLHTNTREPDRLLRIGFVSADLRSHAVASFVEPLLQTIDPAQFIVFAYANYPTEDAVSERMKAYVHDWTNIAWLSDDEVAEQIRSDGIDILFDLSGHTGGNRLRVFAMKPAPLQVSWIGHPNTTGLTTVDYYLADKNAAPSGLIDHLFSEKVARLPAGFQFQPFPHAPPANPLPAITTGSFTFGSFNRTDKLTAEIVALWSKALRAVPDSRMLLAGLADPSHETFLKQEFAHHGIADNRLAFHYRVPMAEYLALHHNVDVILDTYPFAGLTTSCHAVWMGVPVLTMTGETLASRAGTIVNSHLGLEKFIANSEMEFTAAAQHWSHSLPELSGIRATLRSRMNDSLLCRPGTATRFMEYALRAMWRRWCAGLPPESFDVEE